LFVDMPGRGEAEMFQESPDHLFLKTPRVTSVFERDPSGRVSAVSFTESGKTMTAAKIN
jgi:hypothetical protein